MNTIEELTLDQLPYDIQRKISLTANPRLRFTCRILYEARCSAEEYFADEGNLLEITCLTPQFFAYAPILCAALQLSERTVRVAFSGWIMNQRNELIQHFARVKPFYIELVDFICIKNKAHAKFFASFLRAADTRTNSYAEYVLRFNSVELIRPYVSNRVMRAPDEVLVANAHYWNAHSVIEYLARNFIPAPRTFVEMVYSAENGKLRQFYVDKCETYLDLLSVQILLTRESAHISLDARMGYISRKTTTVSKNAFEWLKTGNAALYNLKLRQLMAQLRDGLEIVNIPEIKRISTYFTRDQIMAALSPQEWALYDALATF